MTCTGGTLLGANEPRINSDHFWQNRGSEGQTPSKFSGFKRLRWQNAKICCPRTPTIANANMHLINGCKPHRGCGSHVQFFLQSLQHKDLDGQGSSQDDKIVQLSIICRSRKNTLAQSEYLRLRAPFQFPRLQPLHFLSLNWLQQSAFCLSLSTTDLLRVLLSQTYLSDLSLIPSQQKAKASLN